MCYALLILLIGVLFPMDEVPGNKPSSHRCTDVAVCQSDEDLYSIQAKIFKEILIPWFEADSRTKSRILFESTGENQIELSKLTELLGTSRTELQMLSDKLDEELSLKDPEQAGEDIRTVFTLNCVDLLDRNITLIRSSKSMTDTSIAYKFRGHKLDVSKGNNEQVDKGRALFSPGREANSETDSVSGSPHCFRAFEQSNIQSSFLYYNCLKADHSPSGIMECSLRFGSMVLETDKRYCRCMEVRFGQDCSSIK